MTKHFHDDEFQFALPRIDGTNKPDTYNGSLGGDTYYGLGGDDTIDGKGGNDKLHGGVGNDDVRGSEGNDKLWGDDGNDKLFGGDGKDTLTGGKGTDTFYYVSLIGTPGIDTVTDFHAKGRQMDLIDLEYSGVPGEFSTWDNIKSHLSEHDGDVVITFGEGAEMILKHLAISDLHANNFMV
jgi:Ca2+-binding RTX toxin-like protein